MCKMREPVLACGVAVEAVRFEPGPQHGGHGHRQGLELLCQVRRVGGHAVLHTGIQMSFGRRGNGIRHRGRLLPHTMRSTFTANSERLCS